MLIIKALCIICVVTNIHTVANYNCQYNLSTGETYSFCCDNHEEKDGQCIECQVGYKSIDGKPCAECSVGWWGRKCKTKCRCKDNEQCNHRKGCTEQLVEFANFSTPDFKELTEVQTYINTWKIDETTNQILTENRNKDTYFIVLYIMIASSTIICTAVVCCRSKRNMIQKLKRSEEDQSHQLVQNQSHQPVQQNRSAEYIDVIDENAYESIEDVSTDDAAISVDASKIHGNSIFLDNDQNSTSTSSNESVEITDDGYLTPYEPLNDHIEKHDYKKIEPTVDIVFRREDTSSNSDKTSTDSSGYLKPVKIEDTVI